MRPCSQTVTNTGVGAWMPIDAYQTGLYALVVSGTPTYSVEVTPDNIFDPAVTPQAYPCLVAALTAATTTQNGIMTLYTRAVRVNVTGTGVVKLTAITKNIGP